MPTTIHEMLRQVHMLRDAMRMPVRWFCEVEVEGPHPKRRKERDTFHVSFPSDRPLLRWVKDEYLPWAPGYDVVVRAHALTPDQHVADLIVFADGAALETYFEGPVESPETIVLVRWEKSIVEPMTGRPHDLHVVPIEVFDHELGPPHLIASIPER